MKNLNAQVFCLLIFCLSMFTIGCSSDDDIPEPEIKDPVVHTFTPADTNQDDVTAIFINVQDGEIIEFGPGTFNFNNTLSMINKSCVIIRGAGRDETILNFGNQVAGAEGLKLTNTNNILIEKLTILDTEGDAVKIKDAKGVQIIDVGVEWSGEPSVDNGAYGLYPVTCEDVIIDNCYVRGASDAGIYVGQSTYVNVKNSETVNNVAGIEIENCNYAEVFNCNTHDNTGGILVFDLPNLDVKNGLHCKIYDNTVTSNDYPNFAPEGNIVANVPSGTGIMLMTSKKVEVYNNTITNNNTMGVAIVSYPVLAFFDSSLSNDDTEYRPFIEDIYIHDNSFSRTNTYPSNQNIVGIIVQGNYPDGDIPDIVFDGLSGSSEENLTICISNNGNARFTNIDAENDFANVSEDVTKHTCDIGALEAVIVADLDCE